MFHTPESWILDLIAAGRCPECGSRLSVHLYGDDPDDDGQVTVYCDCEPMGVVYLREEVIPEIIELGERQAAEEFQNS